MNPLFPAAGEMGPLLILGIVLIAGETGGWAARRLHVPGITGNIVAGALLGLTLFHEVEVAKALQPLSTFAICPDGVDFDAPDGLPVKLIVLIVTPEEHEKHHIEVLASLSAMISDTHVSARLMAAEDPNEAWEVIESRESRPYNYFLEDDENGQGQPIRAATPPSTL